MSILDGFDVVKATRTFSISEVRVLKNRVSFNVCSASELGYPAFVRMFISKDKTQIALQPCEKIKPNAMKFFTIDGESNKKIKRIGVGNRALATLIKSGIGWDSEEPVCAPGIRFPDENVIIFDLKQAYTKDDHVGNRMYLVPTPSTPFYLIPPEFFPDNHSVVDIPVETAMS